VLASAHVTCATVTKLIAIAEITRLATAVARERFFMLAPDVAFIGND
jgi:hypothetical protein